MSSRAAGAAAILGRSRLPPQRRRAGRAGAAPGAGPQGEAAAPRCPGQGEGARGHREPRGKGQAPARLVLPAGDSAPGCAALAAGDTTLPLKSFFFFFFLNPNKTPRPKYRTPRERAVCFKSCIERYIFPIKLCFGLKAKLIAMQENKQTIGFLHPIWFPKKKGVTNRPWEAALGAVVRLNTTPSCHLSTSPLSALQLGQKPLN